MVSVSAPWISPSFFPTLPIHDETGLPTLAPIVSEPSPGTDDGGGSAGASVVRRDCLSAVAFVGIEGDVAVCLSTGAAELKYCTWEGAVCDMVVLRNSWPKSIPVTRLTGVGGSFESDRAGRLCRLPLLRIVEIASVLLDRTASTWVLPFATSASQTKDIELIEKRLLLNPDKAPAEEELLPS